MEKKRIGVIGVGGRTGTMFCFELKEVANIIGIGKDIKNIQEKKLFIERKGMQPELFKAKVITDSQFLNLEFLPEILFLTTKNPVGGVVRYYYQKIKQSNPLSKQKLNLPTLILSQNGIIAGEEAISVLKEVFGPDYKKIRVVRLILLNPIDKREINGKTYINYSLPIRIGFGKISGPGNLQDIAALFKKADFEIKEFPQEEVRNLELSKLFLNLIGIASATRGLSIKEGFQKKEVLKEEIEALKEYIKVVRAEGGRFLNLFHYPVRTLSFFLDFLPSGFFLPVKNYIARTIIEERKGKIKDLSEIEYYNGAVVNLGKKLKISTPINQRILERWTELAKAQAPKA